MIQPRQGCVLPVGRVGPGYREEQVNFRRDRWHHGPDSGPLTGKAARHSRGLQQLDLEKKGVYSSYTRLSLVEVLESKSLFLQGMAGSRLPIAVAHGEGRAHFGRGGLDAARDAGLLALRYVDNHGRPTEAYPANPNGSPRGITGLCNADGRFTIMMPHPERVFRSVQYSWAPEDWGEDGPWLRLFAGDEHKLTTELESFSLLIPYNPDDDNKRDYHRRAELGPRGAFRRRNTITLVANGDDGVLSQLDTRVRRIVPVEEGIYTGHQVVILDVIPSTLSYSDQRRHYRVHTRLPATLHLRDGGSYPCTLLDFSEKSVQLELDEADMSEELESLSEFRRLTLGFDLGDERQPRPFELDGSLYRRSGRRMVMKLLGIYRDGKSEELGLVDVLEIKSSLLKHPATQAGQQTDNP